MVRIQLLRPNENVNTIGLSANHLYSLICYYYEVGDFFVQLPEKWQEDLDELRLAQPLAELQTADLISVTVGD